MEKSHSDLSIEKQHKFILKYENLSHNDPIRHNQSISDLNTSYGEHTLDDPTCINVNQTSNKSKDSFENFNCYKKTNLQHLTIHLNRHEDKNDNIKQAKCLNEILTDIQTLRNQLCTAHGSIYTEVYSSRLKSCLCSQIQSVEICQRISEFENEFLRKKSIEYVYKIESMKNKNNIVE